MRWWWVLLKKGKQKKVEERKGAIIGGNYVFKGNICIIVLNEFEWKDKIKYKKGKVYFNFNGFSQSYCTVNQILQQ